MAVSISYKERKEEQMYVSVKYRQSDNAWGYKSYTYQTDLPLKVGERVVAPTYNNPEQEAIVCGVRMPEPPFECKAITQRWEDAANG